MIVQLVDGVLSYRSAGIVVLTSLFNRRQWLIVERMILRIEMTVMVLEAVGMIEPACEW